MKRNTGKIAVYQKRCIEVRKTKSDSHGRLPCPRRGMGGLVGGGRGAGGWEGRRTVVVWILK